MAELLVQLRESSIREDPVSGINYQRSPRISKTTILLENRIESKALRRGALARMEHNKNKKEHPRIGKEGRQLHECGKSQITYWAILVKARFIVELPHANLGLPTLCLPLHSCKSQVPGWNTAALTG